MTPTEKPVYVSIPQRVQPRYRPVLSLDGCDQFDLFPSLKGFNLAIDEHRRRFQIQDQVVFPSLKGFNLAIDYPITIRRL